MLSYDQVKSLNEKTKRNNNTFEVSYECCDCMNMQVAVMKFLAQGCGPVLQSELDFVSCLN